ncbi:MAG: TolC family protein [bacterium]
MKKYLILILSIFLIGISNAQTKLSLDEAISIALQRNSSLIVSTNNLETNKSQLKNAYGQLLPNFGLQAGWDWQRVTDDGGGFQVDQFGNPTEIPETKLDTRNYSLGAGGNWTLFDGLANIATISARKSGLEAAEFSLEKLKQDLVLQTMELYYAVLNAQALLKVRQENVAYNSKFLEQIQERNKLGSIALADVYQQQVQLGNAELALIQTENVLTNAKSTILNFLALDVFEEYEFVDPFSGQVTVDADKYLKEFNDLGVMVSEAFDNRLDYKVGKLTLSGAEDGITAARSGLMPTLSGNYFFSTSATKTGDLFNRKIWGAGLSLNVPIFSNWSTENQMQMAEVSAKNEQENLNALERQIKIEVKQGYLDLVASKKSLEVSSKNLVSAEENRKINNERYNLGGGTILEVLQSDRNYQDAVSTKINALYEFYRLKDRLKNYLGKLDYKQYE